MKTFVLLIFAVALAGAAIYTRPTRDDFKKSFVASATAGDANFIETAFNKWHAGSYLGGCEFKDRILWVDVEKDGKTVFTGVFGHWFRHEKSAAQGRPTRPGLVTPCRRAVQPPPFV